MDPSATLLAIKLQERRIAGLLDYVSSFPKLSSVAKTLKALISIEQKKSPKQFYLPRTNSNGKGYLEELEILLREKDRVVILGMGGVGKSTLVYQFQIDEEEKGTEVKWIFSETAEKMEEDLLDLIVDIKAFDELKILTETISSRSKAIRSIVREYIERIVQSKEILFVFDNAVKVEDVEFYISKWPPTTKVLITTRNEAFKSLTNIAIIKIEYFPSDEAREFLYSKLIVQNTSTEEKDLIGEIIAHYSTNGSVWPLQISLVANNILNNDKMTLLGFVNMIKSEPSAIDIELVPLVQFYCEDEQFANIYGKFYSTLLIWIRI